ncbi:CapA family protein [Candidatus Woesebacteria bacterium]|nr:CapA family protein [Candidatus Woesebacteria bacterium]
MSIRLLFIMWIAAAVVFLLAGVTGWYLNQVGIIATPRNSVSDQFLTKTKSEELLASATPSATPTPSIISFYFVGDMMFDRNIRLNAQKRGGYGSILSTNLKKLFANSDLVVGNLEGPVTSNPSKSVGSTVGSPANYVFTFDPAIVPFLYENNIRLVNLGNNHILNFGQAGLEETYELLADGNINSFGATGRVADYQRWLSIPIKGVNFAFVNYNQFTDAGYAQALADLESAREASDVVILYTHWGNEYVPENALLKEQARDFMNNGADLIIGSHPHVVTGVEQINGKTVYYSLGNFIFDQYFEPAVKNGLVVSAQYDAGSGQFVFADLPVVLEPNGTTSLANEL